MNFYLEEPTIERKKDAIDYISEFLKYDSDINGTGLLDKYLKEESYENWLIYLSKVQNKDYAYSINFVPNRTFFLIREEDNKIVGMINIRLELNEKLKNSGGHIGYSIRPTERRKGYNKINLYLGLKKCFEYNIKDAWLDCVVSNLGSVKTIQALGGNLLKEDFSDKYGEVVQMYTINVIESLNKYSSIYDNSFERNI
jgi:predicted acetyltransferase